MDLPIHRVLTPSGRVTSPEFAREPDTSQSRTEPIIEKWKNPQLPEYDVTQSHKPTDATDDLLRANVVPHPDSDFGFFPLRLFDHLFGPRTVEMIVSDLAKDRGPVELASESAKSDLKDTICGKGGPGFRRVLAILVLSSRSKDILKLIHGQITDARLPLQKNLLKEILGWKDLYADMFLHYQKSFKVEFLSAPSAHSRLEDTDNGDGIRHFTIEPGALRPWVKLSIEASPSSRLLASRTHLLSVNAVHHQESGLGGGFGDVYKVLIHPWQHDLSEKLQILSAKDSIFALKRLKVESNSKENFEKETTMLKRFGGRHPNIVTLLATITCKDKENEGKDEHYLLFPWAEGDLLGFWENGNARHDYTTIRWVANQCYALVEAVAFIHDPGHKDADGKALYGRHGDIKPENILWFKNNQDNDILVLSDLGIAAIHREISRSEQAPTMPVTFNYKPPEYDMAGHQGRISRSFDIWTLGCVFFEFTIWILNGRNGRQKFNSDLSSPYINGFHLPLFFDVRPSSAGSDTYVFQVKENVTKTFAKLHMHAKCSQYMHELLDLVQNHMLIVESATPRVKRIDAATLLKRFGSMRDKCGDNDYCLKPCPRETGYKPHLPVESGLSTIAQKMAKDKNAEELPPFEGAQTRKAKASRHFGEGLQPQGH